MEAENTDPNYGNPEETDMLLWLGMLRGNLHWPPYSLQTAVWIFLCSSHSMQGFAQD